MRKHLLIYYDNGQLVQTRPRIWAIEFNHLFPANIYRNPDNVPTTESIERFLINNYNFMILENHDLSVCYNLDVNLVF